MTSIPDIFGTMAYGPAPEAVAPAHAWLDQHERRFGLFIGGTWTAPGGETFESLNPATGKPLARLTQAGAADVDRAVRAARAAQAAWWGLGGHGRARYLYAHRPAGPEAQPPVRRARVARQRQADPGVARHRCAAGGAAFLSSRGLGAAHGTGAPGSGAGGRHRADHPLELSAAHAGLEDRARAGHGKHGGAQARRVHLAHGAPLRRAVRGGRAPARRRQHHHRRWAHRRGDRGPPRRRQDRVHRLDRGRADHPHRDGRERARSSRSSWAASRHSSSSPTPTSTAWSRAWWTRSGSTRARSAAPARASWCRKAWRSASWPSSRPGWRRSASAIRSTRPWTWAPSSRRSSCRRSRSWCGADRKRARSCGSPRGAARARAGSSRRRCSPRSRPPRPSRRWRSSVRWSC